MCTCGSLPGHDECSRCAVPFEEAGESTGWALPGLPATSATMAQYEEHEPF
ncbi:hypothetical protein ACIGHB_30345 [Streptomyces sp. NPDC085460]|uniref:hypothetical protein n=1 Tax=Streptomyces sp. NPDC085460 TaxID=3365723 RepID=UPI0037CD916C